MMPIWCEIYLDHLVDNYNEIKKYVGEEVDLLPVLKADAYGHGAIECAKVLLQNGAKSFALARVDEAIQLRKAGIDCPLLILGYIAVEEIHELTDYNLTPTVYHIRFAKELARRATRQVKVHIKIDTGMGRLGFRGLEETVKAIDQIQKLKNITIEGIYSHLSASDEEDKTYSLSQMEKFNQVLSRLDEKGISIPIKHTSNSAAIMDLPVSHYNWVRPGIVLYGMYPSDQVKKERLNLKPVKSFKTVITNIKTIDPGDSISYGRTYIAKEKSKIATLAVGYADGFSRMLSGKGEVLIRGERAKIVGRVCMDQCMADVTHISGVKVNDEVLLYGAELPIEEMAEKMGTINYEISCMISPRVPKIYFWKKDYMKMDKSIFN